MKRTTKIIYRYGNSLGLHYSPKNCNGYGTKWRITLQKDKYSGYWKQIGFPTLLNENWDIDEKKVEKSIDFLTTLY